MSRTIKTGFFIARGANSFRPVRGGDDRKAAAFQLEFQRAHDNRIVIDHQYFAAAAGRCAHFGPWRRDAFLRQEGMFFAGWSRLWDRFSFWGILHTRLLFEKPGSGPQRCLILGHHYKETIPAQLCLK